MEDTNSEEPILDLEDRLYTRREVCNLLNISDRTLRNYEFAGRVKPVRLAGKKNLRYTRKAILSLISEDNEIVRDGAE